MDIEAVDSDTFDGTVVQSEVPVLVFFYARWCGLCKAMLPEIAGVAGTLQGRALVVRCCVDDSPALAERHAITGVPAAVLFHGGTAQAHHAGIMAQATLAGHLEGYFSAHVF